MRLPAAPAPPIPIWGAVGELPKHPIGEDVVHLPEKKGRGKERIPSQSLHPASPHCPNAINLCKALVPPDPTLITHLLRKIFKIRHGKGRQPTRRQNSSFPPLASPLALSELARSCLALGEWAVGGGALGVGGCSLSKRIG